MEEILDDFQQNNQDKSTFSILSFSFSVITLVLTIIILSQIKSHYSASERLPMKPPMGLIWAIRISCVLGVVSAIMSILRKEKLRYVKTIGIFLNFLLLVLIGGTVLYAAILDAGR